MIFVIYKSMKQEMLFYWHFGGAVCTQRRAALLVARTNNSMCRVQMTIGSIIKICWYVHIRTVALGLYSFVTDVI